MQKDFNKFLKSNYNIYPNDGFGDVYSKLFELDRIIFLNSDLNEYTANLIKAQLLYLNYVDPTKDIKLYIDSGGGSVYNSMGILDTIDIITCDVETVNIGLAASMAAVLLSYGTKGKRKSLKRSKTMIHQPMTFAEGQASDINITATEVMGVKKELIQILADRSGKKFTKVETDSDRDYWMTAEETKKYGIIDIIL